MADIVEAKISGGAELFEALENLPKAAAKAIIRAGLRSAAGIWRAEMKQRAQKGWHVWKGSKRQGRSRDFAFVSEHIGMKVVVRGDELEGTCQVGPVRKGFWSLFMEFGTRHSSAHPFIRQSFDARRTDVLDQFITVCKEKLAALGLK
jgi:HK97 gp10 family phage protein